MTSSLNLLGSGCALGAPSPLEAVIGLDLLFHLGLDLFEILRRDAVWQFDVVIKAVFNRRPGGELRLRLDLQDGGGEDVRGGMAEPFQIGHLGALVGCFAFVSHEERKLTASLGDSIGHAISSDLRVEHGWRRQALV